MELDLDAPAEPAAAQDETQDEVPEAAGAEPEEEDPQAVLLLDINGALAPLMYRDGLEHMVAPGHGTIMYDQAIMNMNRIAAMPVTKAWLSSWEDDAPENFGDHLLPTATEVLIADAEETGWCKIDASGVAESEPAGPPRGDDGR